jgi:hypothetical protein
MKRPAAIMGFAIAALVLGLGSSGVRGAEGDARPRPEGRGKFGKLDPEKAEALKAKFLEKFDKNGDGQLDQSEKAAVKEAFQKKRQEGGFGKGGFGKGRFGKGGFGKRGEAKGGEGKGIPKQD